MKIGLVCPYHISRPGGVLELIQALQKEYEKSGHTAKIITPMPKGHGDPLPDSVITVGTSRNTKMFGGTSWQWSVSVDADAIDEVLKREKFDVLHFHEPWIPVWSRQILMRSKTANVATLHARFFDTMTAKTVNTVIMPYAKPMLKYFDVVTAPAEVATEYFRTLSKRHVSIIPNGIDVTKYSADSAKPSQRKQKVILYVGRLEDRKGIKYLLMAFSELAKSRHDVRLVIAGAGDDEEKLRDMVSEESIPRVTFDARYITEQEKIDYMHNADLFCSAAHYGESFGIVLLEAMAAGLPIVAGDNVGYEGVLKERGALSLVNSKDTIDFARRLELMLYDEDLRKLYLQWADEYVKQFDYPIVSNNYLDVYKQAIEHHEQHRKNA